MKKFSEDFKFKDSGLALSRTLMIKKIPEDLSTEDNMRRHLSEAYADCQVLEINMAYDVADLTQVTEELRDAEDAKKEAEQYEMDHGGKPMMMYPKACSRFSGLFCRCCSEKVSQAREMISSSLIMMSRCLGSSTTRRRWPGCRRRWRG